MAQTHFKPGDREDPLEKETATHSSILAWETLWTEEPSPRGRKESDMTEWLNNDKLIVRI